MSINLSTQTVGNLNPLILMIRQSKNEDELYEIIKKNGITHMLLNVPEARRLAPYDIFHFEGKDLEIFIKFWNKYVKEIDIADSSLPEREIYSIKKQLSHL